MNCIRCSKWLAVALCSWQHNDHTSIDRALCLRCIPQVEPYVQQFTRAPLPDEPKPAEPLAPVSCLDMDSKPLSRPLTQPLAAEPKKPARKVVVPADPQASLF